MTPSGLVKRAESVERTAKLGQPATHHNPAQTPRNGADSRSPHHKDNHVESCGKPALPAAYPCPVPTVTVLHSDRRRIAGHCTISLRRDQRIAPCAMLP